MPPRRNQPGVTEGIGIDEIWVVIRRRLWLSGFLVAATLVVTMVILSLMTPTYTAQTQLLIQPDAPQVLNMTQLLDDTAGSPDYDYYKTQFELLKSRALAARVIRELKLAHNGIFNPGPPRPGSWADLWIRARQFVFMPFGQTTSEGPSPVEYSVDPNLIDKYVACLKIEPVFATRLVNVSFTLPDPFLATRIVSAHVHDFVKREIEIRSGGQRAAQEFLNSQLIEIGKRTEQAEVALNAYRKRYGVLSFDVDDINKVAAERMSELTRAVTDAETRRITAESEVELLQHGGYDSLPEVVNNATISGLKPQLVALQTEYARLSAAFNPAYPKLVELKAQLDQDQEAISAQVNNVAKAVRRSYKAAVAQETRLRDEIEAEKQRDLALNDALLHDAVLSREVQTNRDLYKNVLQRMEEMSVAAQTPLSNVSAVADAAVPLAPSGPKKYRDVAIAGVLSVLLSLALTFVLEQLDQRLKTPEEIEAHLNLPTLAVVPDFANLFRARGDLRRRLTAGRARVTSIVSPSGSTNALSLLDTYKPGASEIYRTIRTHLVFSRPASPPKTVLFTSSVETEGKTWTVLHTAAAFAHTGAATLLISADLRRPRCDRLLNCQGEEGLSDALVGRRDAHDVIRRVDGQAFSFLSAGSPVPNPAELLSSARMREIIDSLTTYYPIILFDSAPVMHASETIAIAAMVEGVVIVVGARTSKKTVRAACDRLNAVDAKILGVVLNGVDIRHPDYREYTKYYYRYDYDGENGSALVGSSSL